jgi:glycosyltransferase involved in cell wall biosynthesis
MNIIGPINQLGYGITALNIVKHLSKITNVSLWPIGQPQVVNQEDFDIVQYCINNAKLPDFNAPCIRIWHQNDMSQFVGKGCKIGFPIFELNKFDKVEKHHLSNVDKIFVCSKWAKEVVCSSISIEENNVCIIPLGVDTSIFKPYESNISDKTIFFNCGKWEVRKGHDIIAEAFNKAFEETDNVELWMMCGNPFCTQEEEKYWQSLYLNSKLGSKIKLLPRVETQNEVYNIMKNTHCGIFPSRAEGWNLELLEMMACGKTVITTDYSAHTEFCNQKNSMLISIDSQESAYDGKWFHGQGDWASFGKSQKDQLIAHMKTFHAQRKDIGVNLNGIETAKIYSWDNTARRIQYNAI